MALIKCPECKNKISEHAKTCPSCGYTITLLEIHQIKKENKQTNIAYWIIAIIALIVFINMCSDDTDSSYNNSNNTTTSSSRIYTKYSTANLNVRESPNTRSKVVKVLKPNEAVKTHNKLKNNFVEILNSNGSIVGWVSNKYLQNKPLSKSKITSLKEKKKQQIHNEEIGHTNLDKRLIRELKSISKGVSFSTYRGSVEMLQMEMVLFGAWARYIDEGITSGNNETILLARKLESKVAEIQKKEYPFLRKEYVKFIKETLREMNFDENRIQVYVSGHQNQYLNFKGAELADKEISTGLHSSIHEIILTFRFSEGRYHWGNNSNEYYYWSVFTGKDTDMIQIK